MKVSTNEPAAGDVLACLLETADASYLDAAELSADGVRCLVVRDGDFVAFAAAYVVTKRPHGRELEILTANGKRANAVRWLPAVLEVFEALGAELGCNRIMVPVTRPALKKALEKLRFSPFTSLMMKAL